MRSQLHKAGIEAELSYAPFTVLFQTLLPSGGFDAASFAWVNVTESSGYGGVYGCGGDQNWSGYCQRIVTDDLAQADRILDSEQQARVLNRADRLLATDVPILPLYQIPWVLAYKSTLRNVVPSPTNLFWNAEDWWLDR